MCYNKAHLRKKTLYHVFQIFDRIKSNAQLAISLDNARLASDDFRVK